MVVDRSIVRQKSSKLQKWMTLGILALAVAIFVAIVAWPSDEPETVPVATPSPLENKLDDQATQKYLATLKRVKPNRSRRLNKDAETAILAGASHNELAVLVLAARPLDRTQDFDHLLKADIVYIDKLLRMLQTGATLLSKQAPKYCRPATYDAYESFDPRKIASESALAFSYGSSGYDWLLRFNLMTLEAIEAGQESPNELGQLTQEDEQALQGMITDLMARPKFAELTELQGMPNAERQRAIGNMNMCELVAEAILAVNRLPNETKSRLFNELHSTAERDSFRTSILGPLMGR